MYNGFTTLSLKHCSVMFICFLNNLMTNEAETSTGKLSSLTMGRDSCHGQQLDPQKIKP